MIDGRMTRVTRIILIAAAALALAVLASACGTEHIGPPAGSPNFAQNQAAAKLFNQRCGGCHTLSVAGTQGSGLNPRTYLNISGPNFDVRCERPAIRVMYAITNGGFSGTYMPQNIVTGHDAVMVANFVAQWAGRDAPVEPGTVKCIHKPLDPISGILTPAQSAKLIRLINAPRVLVLHIKPKHGAATTHTVTNTVGTGTQSETVTSASAATVPTNTGASTGTGTSTSGSS